MLAGGLAAILGLIAVAMLAAWVPHYVLWPWARDADTFATLAQSWDQGVRPYRDIHGYNFPGAIYLFWLLGKVFGWGRTWPFYAFDAAMIGVLGLVLTAWSRRCLGGSLPGLAAYVVFLTYYLNRDFETVAQRDWHASLAPILGILALQAWPGRGSVVLAAMLAAAAVATRPHAVVFLPASALAVLEGVGDVPPLGTVRSRRLILWLVLLASFTALAFAPLAVAGIGGDLLRGLRTVAFGGPYNRAGPGTMARTLVDQLVHPATAVVITLLAVVIAMTSGSPRRRAVTWLVAVAGALLYRLPHPVQHGYLGYPLALTGAVALAPGIAWFVERASVPSSLRALAVLMLVAEASVGLPAFCEIGASMAAVRSIARGETCRPGRRRGVGRGSIRAGAVVLMGGLPRDAALPAAVGRPGDVDCQRARGAAVPGDQRAGGPDLAVPGRVGHLLDVAGGHRPRARVRRRARAARSTAWSSGRRASSRCPRNCAWNGWLR